jgi:acetyl-CoA/propionyl-CoA carboxylase biotin carboxyl carrier protein
VLTSVLIANRGEISVRITRTLRTMGIRSIAVYSAVDAGARHVVVADDAIEIGPGALSESYLSVERIIEAAQRSGAEAVHPGYGFLSEAPELAAACEAAGLVFVGPSATTIELMGDKIRAKRAVAAAGIPTVPGRTEPGLGDDDLAAAVAEIGYPALLKPSAGGGGKGMRLLEGAERLDEVIASARREAVAAFGDGTLFVERYLPRARHLEVQVLADAHGNVVHLGERECSLQRRHQKIVEEAPSVLLDEAARASLGAQAVTVARASGYVNAGTVEFIINAEDPAEAYFMEMNSRLQVEHPVTEEVYGIDLVEQQLRIAAGEVLGLDQAELVPLGHAVEVRIYAEDPSSGFLPTGGTIVRLREPGPELARVESGLLEGAVVGSSFDPMLSKLIAWAPDRASALARVRLALADNQILGVVTNTGFLRELLAANDVAQGRLDTGLVERLTPQLAQGGPDDLDRAVASIAALLLDAEPSGVWDLSGWRIAGAARSLFAAVVAGVEMAAEIEAISGGWLVRLGDGSEHRLAAQLADGELRCDVDGGRRRYGVARSAEGLWLGRDGSSWLFSPIAAGAGGPAGGGAGHVASPMPGVVAAVLVAEGDAVAEGDVLMVVEAMKMEHALRAGRSGRVAWVRASVGDQVVLGQVVAEIEGADDGL